MRNRLGKLRDGARARDDRTTHCSLQYADPKMDRIPFGMQNGKMFPNPSYRATRPLSICHILFCRREETKMRSKVPTEVKTIGRGEKESNLSALPLSNGPCKYAVNDT